MSRDLLTVHEAAEYLRVKASWIYAHSAELGAQKCGHFLRFRREHLDAYLTDTRGAA